MPRLSYVSRATVELPAQRAHDQVVRVFVVFDHLSACTHHYDHCNQRHCSHHHRLSKPSRSQPAAAPTCSMVVPGACSCGPGCTLVELRTRVSSPASGSSSSSSSSSPVPAAHVVRSLNAEFARCGGCIAQQPLLERGVGPGARHQLRAVAPAAALLHQQRQAGP